MNTPMQWAFFIATILAFLALIVLSVWLIYRNEKSAARIKQLQEVVERMTQENLMNLARISELEAEQEEEWWGEDQDSSAQPLNQGRIYQGRHG